jgi:hypothetical protein
MKDAEKGDVEAIIATLGVVDKDEDIIRPGRDPRRREGVDVGYGHDAVYGAAPVGKGTIVVEGNKASSRAACSSPPLDGRDTFECLKEMGADQEWSFGFRILGAECRATRSGSRARAAS